MTNIRRNIKDKLKQANNDIARLLDNVYYVMAFYLPDNVDIDKASEDLMNLFVVISERPDININDLYIELMKAGKMVDLGHYAKYIIRCYSVILIASELQDTVNKIYNHT